MSTTAESAYTAWCWSLFGSLADGAVWGVPRSGLVFRRNGDRLVLTDRMPWDADLPVTAEELREQQDDDFDSIVRHFGLAGVTVVEAGDGASA